MFRIVGGQKRRCRLLLQHICIESTCQHLYTALKKMKRWMRGGEMNVKCFNWERHPPTLPSGIFFYFYLFLVFFSFFWMVLYQSLLNYSRAMFTLPLILRTVFKREEKFSYFTFSFQSFESNESSESNAHWTQWCVANSHLNSTRHELRDQSRLVFHSISPPFYTSHSNYVGLYTQFVAPDWLLISD